MSDEKDRAMGQKLVLVAVAVTLAANVAMNWPESLLERVGYHGELTVLLQCLIFFASAFAYIISGAIAVRIAEGLLLFALVTDDRAWSVPARALAGAFWPPVLVFCILITVFFAIINRIF